MKYDIIIVGGGISGLYAAYNLCKNKKILLIERSSELGGRIKTDTIQDFPIELGAARFSNKHKNLLSLLKKFKFNDKFYELPKDINYYYKNKKLNYDINKKFKKLNSSKKNKLNELNLLQYSQMILGEEEAEKLQKMFGYDSEFLNLNASAALEMFKQDLFKDVKYYVLNGGLKQLIKSLEDHLINNNVTIKKETNITEITDNLIIDSDNHKYSYHNLILAIPKVDLELFCKFKDYDLLNSVTEIPLIRIYAKYPKDKNNKVWFHDLKRTITDNFIRHIIPIDYENGIIMISYSDGNLAQMWNNLYLLGEKELTKKIKKEIKKLLNINIPDPLEYNVYYWKEGVHMWKPHFDMKKSNKQIMKPFPNKNIYICNEAFSKHQCWIEGSLTMVKDLIKLIKNKKTKKKQVGGRKVKKTIKKSLPTYKIDSVLKHNNWIIFDHSNKKFIYQISSSWFKNHPGGRSNIVKGIKANSFYNKKDPNRSTESPIQLFKSIGKHSRSNVLKDYIKNLKKPKWIKLIGLLK